MKAGCVTRPPRSLLADGAVLELATILPSFDEATIQESLQRATDGGLRVTEVDHQPVGRCPSVMLPGPRFDRMEHPSRPVDGGAVHRSTPPRRSRARRLSAARLSF